MEFRVDEMSSGEDRSWITSYQGVEIRHSTRHWGTATCFSAPKGSERFMNRVRLSCCQLLFTPISLVDERSKCRVQGTLLVHV